MFKIIGISGPARSGKDTAASIISDIVFNNKSIQYGVISFADPIKFMLASGLDLTTEQLYGDRKQEIDERYGCTPRHLMQTLGTEWGRDIIDQNLWVNVIKNKLNDDENCYIIPDVRFESEAKMIRENGILISINRKGVIKSDHKSESGIYQTERDIIIHNDSTIEDYYLKVERMTKKYLL